MKAAFQQLLIFEKLSFEERNHWIDHQRQSIAKYHINNNPLYKELTAGNYVSWEHLPVLQKRNFQRPVKEMISMPLSEKDVYIANTSGSSGHPFFFAKDKFSHAMTWAFIFHKYEQLGIFHQDLQARFYGIPLDKFSYFKEKLKDYFMNRLRFPVFDMGDVMLKKFFERFKRNKIRYVYGYTNSILLFVKFLLKSNLTLKTECPSLKLCIVTSEVCTNEDKDLIEKVLGVPVVREYGASELDVIAIEDLEGKWMINQSNLYVEVLSEDNKILPLGKEGRLVITSLFNKAMPFIRYEIGDIGTLEYDEKGMVLKRLSGRINDTILLPSGRRSPGLTFYYISRSILESTGILKEFIIKQLSMDHFEFDVVSDRPLSSEEINSIQEKMDIYLEPGLKLRINHVAKIDRPTSGKTKHFYSLLPP